jgi:hypothetical protein
LGPLYFFAFVLGWKIATTPLKTARLIYGDFGFSREFRFKASQVGIPDQPTDAVLERILTTRALVTLGLLTLAVQCVLDPPTALARVASVGAWADGLVVLLTAPVAIVLLVPVLVVIARPGHRSATARAGVRPMVTGVFSALLLLIVALPVPGLTSWLDTAARAATNDTIMVPLTRIMTSTMVNDGSLHPALLFFLLWIMLFFVAAAYLAQRNGLCAKKNSDLAWLIAPLVGMWSAWWVAAVKIGSPPPEPLALKPWQHVFSTLATPVTVTVLGAVEIRRLRAHGLRFRERRYPESRPRLPIG